MWVPQAGGLSGGSWQRQRRRRTCTPGCRRISSTPYALGALCNARLAASASSAGWAATGSRASCASTSRKSACSGDSMSADDGRCRSGPWPLALSDRSIEAAAGAAHLLLSVPSSFQFEGGGRDMHNPEPSKKQCTGSQVARHQPTVQRPRRQPPWQPPHSGLLATAGFQGRCHGCWCRSGRLLKRIGIVHGPQPFAHARPLLQMASGQLALKSSCEHVMSCEHVKLPGGTGTARFKAG